jgi:cytochrome b6-f complex iron-sulfur subunit
MKDFKKDINSSGRREFLSKLWKILGLVALGELVFFTINLLNRGNKDSNDANSSLLKIIGAVEDFPRNSVTADRINKFYLIRYEDGGFLALSLTCSHLGCSVLWEEAKKEFVCPCHSSSFDNLGNVMNSPAPRPLDYYPVEIEAGKVKIDMTTKIKRKKFDKNQLTYAI